MHATLLKKTLCIGRQDAKFTNQSRKESGGCPRAAGTYWNLGTKEKSIYCVQKSKSSSQNHPHSQKQNSENTNTKVTTLAHVCQFSINKREYCLVFKKVDLKATCLPKSNLGPINAYKLMFTIELSMEKRVEQFSGYWFGISVNDFLFSLHKFL